MLRRPLPHNSANIINEILQVTSHKSLVLTNSFVRYKDNKFIYRLSYVTRTTVMKYGEI